MKISYTERLTQKCEIRKIGHEYPYRLKKQKQKQIYSVLY